MTIWFCGDPHGGTTFLRDALRFCKRPDGIILLGDNMYSEPILPKLQADVQDVPPIWLIHGNHDTDAAAFFQQILGERNIHGKVIDVAGVRIAGLGGVFRGEIWMPPDPPKYHSYEEWHDQWEMAVPPRQRMSREAFLAGKERRHKSSIFLADIERFSGLRADVLVTHEAPSCHPNGFAVIDDLARRLGVKAIFHGHHHKHTLASLACGIVYGVADRAIVDLAGNRIWS